jgi:hypothetical protein
MESTSTECPYAMPRTRKGGEYLEGAGKHQQQQKLDKRTTIFFHCLLGQARRK